MKKYLKIALITLICLPLLQACGVRGDLELPTKTSAALSIESPQDIL